jgi:hypothetical protein
MAKKMKLELKDLRVNSFVTSLSAGEKVSDEEKKQVKGGIGTCTWCSYLKSCDFYCETDPIPCPTVSCP